MTAWTDLVSSVYKSGHANDKNYTFKQALMDASKQKKSGKMATTSSKKVRKSKGKRMGGKSKGKKMGGKSCKNGKSRKMRGGMYKETLMSPLSPATLGPKDL